LKNLERDHIRSLGKTQKYLKKNQEMEFRKLENIIDKKRKDVSKFNSLI
jgi:hypothetical protein